MPYGMAVVGEDQAIEVAAIEEAEEEAEEFLHYARESANPFGSNNLIQLPVRFMHKGSDLEEGPALLDCGATHSCQAARVAGRGATGYCQERGWDNANFAGYGNCSCRHWTSFQG